MDPEYPRSERIQDSLEGKVNALTVNMAVIFTF